MAKEPIDPQKESEKPFFVQGVKIDPRTFWEQTNVRSAILTWNPKTGCTLLCFLSGTKLFSFSNLSWTEALSIAGRLMLESIPGNHNIWVRVRGRECVLASDNSEIARTIIAQLKTLRVRCKVVRAKKLALLTSSARYIQDDVSTSLKQLARILEK